MFDWFTTVLATVIASFFASFIAFAQSETLDAIKNLCRGFGPATLEIVEREDAWSTNAYFISFRWFLGGKDVATKARHLKIEKTTAIGTWESNASKFESFPSGTGVFTKHCDRNANEREQSVSAVCRGARAFRGRAPHCARSSRCSVPRSRRDSVT